MKLFLFIKFCRNQKRFNSLLSLIVYSILQRNSRIWKMNIMGKMKLSRKEIGDLGLYEFLGYIGAMNRSTFGGKIGTERLIELLKIPEKSEQKKLDILEVACSTGHNTCKIAQRYNCHIVGMDISNILITRAKELKNELHLTNVEFEVGDAMLLPYADNSFDVVIAEAIVALLPQKKKVLAEFIRVLKPGGIIGTLDGFVKSEAPQETKDETNRAMSLVMGNSISIKSLDEWNEIFNSTPLNNIQIRSYYDSVFDRSNTFGEIFPILFKLIYHLISNKAIRRKILPITKLGRKMTNKNSIIRKNLGYLLFTGIK